MTRSVCAQVKNTQGGGAGGHLLLVATAVTYNSVFRGECRRQSASLNVPARSG